jgi:hypothetical protein
MVLVLASGNMKREETAGYTPHLAAMPLPATGRKWMS